MTDLHCPECGASWQDSPTCEDHFHQMSYWELEDARLQAVHHLMVLCFHLQHPSRYSPEALAGAVQMLADFVEGGVTPAEMRRRMRTEVDSGRRTHKITGTPERHGRYDQPVQWAMTVGDVVAGGKENYLERVTAWARSNFNDLRTAGLYNQRGTRAR